MFFVAVGQPPDERPGLGSMSLGRAPSHQDLFRTSADYCASRLSATSIYALLHRESHKLFPDESFADLFEDVGRRSVPPRIVATVMVLQRLAGASDREAVDLFAFDLRWKYAAGVDLDYPSFVHTVLVEMRARLRDSDRPNRIFEAALQMAKEAGWVGRKRVLDSTALYDAVATQDTVTMIRSAIRALLVAVDDALGSELRAVSSATMTTAVGASRRATGTTRPRARRWWMRWPGMGTRR